MIRKGPMANERPSVLELGKSIKEVPCSVGLCPLVCYPSGKLRGLRECLELVFKASGMCVGLIFIHFWCCFIGVVPHKLCC